jgi:hypothetical protein
MHYLDGTTSWCQKGSAQQNWRWLASPASVLRPDLPPSTPLPPTSITSGLAEPSTIANLSFSLGTMVARQEAPPFFTNDGASASVSSLPRWNQRIMLHRVHMATSRLWLPLGSPPGLKWRKSAQMGGSGHNK